MFCLRYCARHRLLTTGHRAEQGRSCSAQRCSTLPAACPDGTAGRCPRWKLPDTMRPSHIDCRPIGMRAVCGLRERRAGARVKPEQAPQCATGCGLGRSRGPQVDWSRSDREDVGPAEYQSFWNGSSRPLYRPSLVTVTILCSSASASVVARKDQNNAVDLIIAIRVRRRENASVIYRSNLCTTMNLFYTVRFQGQSKQRQQD